MNISYASYEDLKNTYVRKIYGSTENELYKPYYFVSEQKNGNLWISIRGSKSVADFATDADFRRTITKIGSTEYAFHTGFYKSAKYVFEGVKQYVKDHDGIVYVTGHSLGASVSIILSLLLHEEFPDKDINSLNYAPAPCTSDNIPENHRLKIVNFVNNDDLVTTLSVANFLRTFKNIFETTTDYKKVASSSYDFLISACASSEEEILKDFAKYLRQHKDEILSVIYDYNMDDHMNAEYLTGVTFRIHKQTPRRITDSLVNPKEVLDHIYISSTMISDHFKDNYLEALKEQIY